MSRFSKSRKEYDLYNIICTVIFGVVSFVGIMIWILTLGDQNAFICGEAGCVWMLVDFSSQPWHQIGAWMFWGGFIFYLVANIIQAIYQAGQRSVC